jgi:hypothetical protein
MFKEGEGICVLGGVVVVVWIKANPETDNILCGQALG